MRRALAALSLAWLLCAGPALADAREDAFIRGVLTAVFERQWGWAPGSYTLRVRDGVATVALHEDAAARRARLRSELGEVAGLQRVQVLGAEEAQPRPGPVTERLYSVLGLTPDTEPFPVGDLFAPLIADPKQPQFFASLRSYSAPGERTTVAAVGFGENFGLYRRVGRGEDDGLQLGISGGLFAQFNLDSPSSDLVNADYTIGLPVTYRRGRTSARLRLYHQSSHLGDEFLLRVRPERVNLSFESLELLLARDWLPWRAYVGGEYLLRREPDDLAPGGLHAGLEYLAGRRLANGGRWVAGVDLKQWEEHDWSTDVSVKLGLEFGAREAGRRSLRVMLEGYDGFAPHGQFYDIEIDYLGFGVYLGF